MIDNPALRHEPVQHGPRPDADEDPFPDPPKDGGELRLGKVMPVAQTQSLPRAIGIGGHLGRGMPEGGEEAFRIDQVEKGAADHAGQHADGHIEQRETQPQQAGE